MSKSLGVLIDKNLTWGSHIERLTKKVAPGIAAIRQSDSQTICSPCNTTSYLQSHDSAHFDYCNVVWGSCGVKLADKLQKLKNRGARARTFSTYDAQASHLLQNLNWKNLSTQRGIQKALIVFKSLNNLAPEYLSSKFIARSHTTSHIFRDSVNKLTIPQPRTNYLRNSFRYSGAVLFPNPNPKP